MTDPTVFSYTIRWNLDNHRGRIALKDSANNVLDDRAYTSPEEFQLVVGILRNEKPVLFDGAQNVLRTGPEPVGEDEQA
jgi:hypothetical protein